MRVWAFAPGRATGRSFNVAVGDTALKRLGDRSRPPFAAEIFPPVDPLSIALAYRPPRLWPAALAGALGVLVGVVGAFSSFGPQRADAAYAASLDLRDAPATSAENAGGRRSDIIAQISAGALERLPATARGALDARSPPKLIVIFDDMGIDRDAFESVMALPGPVTLSFLPYANDPQTLVDRALARGDDVLLHLPMEPSGNADPGPHSISASMRAEKLFRELAWNLDRFDGYVGVNNHMGSKATRDEETMKRVLSMVGQRGLFFIDSLTTGSSAASRAGAAVGAEVFVRDVFLDAEPGGEAIRRQLALAEAIAAKTGYAIVICHPRPETMQVIGPWLTTAPARGYELATASSLAAVRKATTTASAAP